MIAAAGDRRRRFRRLPLSKVYQSLEPGPAVFLTTASSRGPNVMTMSWHMMVEFEPPQIACVVSNANYSFTALRRTGECVIAIPAARLARQVVKVGGCSGRGVDKFAAVGLAPMPAETVKPPLVADRFANLECRVIHTRLVSRYNLFILETQAAWIDPAQPHPKTIHHRGYGNFVADGKTLKLRSRMR